MSQRERAQQLFEQGHTPAEIEELTGGEIPANKVRAWKSRYKWASGNGVQDVAAPVAQQKPQRNAATATLTKMVAAADENTDLTEQQKRFCLLYAQKPNASRAYRLSHEGCGPRTANVEGCRLMTKPKIREEIARQKQIVMESVMADPADLFRQYWDIAFADLADFVAWGRAEVPVMGMYGPVMTENPDDPDGVQVPLTKMVNEVRFLDSTEVDGTLLAEVKQGKDGASVKLADRMAAMRWLSDYFEMRPADRHRREYDRRRLALEEARAEKQDHASMEDVTPLSEMLSNEADTDNTMEGVQPKA